MGLFYAAHIPSKCKMIGGEIFVSKAQNDLREIGNENFVNFTFTGICQDELGQWASLSDNKLIDFYNWSTQPPEKSLGERQCLLYDLEDEKLVALSPTNFPLVCTMPNKPVEFYLRGVCPGLKVDTYFVFKTPFVFLGYIYSSIKYDYNSKEWKIVNNISNRTIASLPAEDNYPPIGHQLWQFDDSTSCFDEGGNTTRKLFLHMAVEQPGHFCCHDGRCFESDLVCDGSPDCQDQEDEKNCQDVIVPQTYDSTRPSLKWSIENGMKTYIKSNISVEVTILDVLEVNEEDSLFEVFYEMTLKWLDPQLEFDFLKSQIDGNLIENTSRIWTPNLVFYHIKNDEVIEESLHAVLNPNDVPRLSANHSFISVREIYSGHNIYLKMTLRRRQTAVCSFPNIGKYPFGTEECSIQFYLQGMQ